MNLDLRQPIEVNTFGFNIPVREFVISAQITRDKRMPLVDEFVLRALNIVETISVTRLAKFFNFEGTDLAVVLADLQGRSLVSLVGDEVSLHPSAQELFRTAADKDSPTIAPVEEFHANVWFDLISQGMISRKGPHNVRNLLYLKPSRSEKDFGADFAREAFDSNFTHFMRRIQGVRNADQWSLYSILDVQPGRLSYAQLVGNEQLLLGETPKVQSVLLPEEADRTPALRKLVAAMADELRHVNNAAPSAASRDEYSRLVGRDSLKRSMRGDGYFNILDWLAMDSAPDDGPTQSIIGYPYINRNAKVLFGGLSKVARVAEADGRRADIHWLRPGGSNWGLTEDLSSFMSELRAALRQLRGPDNVSATLLVPSSVPPKSGRSFERMFDRGIQLPPSSLPAGLEVLVVQGLAAVICTLVPLSGDACVPVGIVTVDPELVGKIEERAKLPEITRAGTQVWKSDPQARSRRAADGEPKVQQ